MTFLDTEELSAFLHGTPVSTLKHWRQVGKGPQCARVGRRILYRRDLVEAWLESLYASKDNSVTKLTA